MVGFGEIQGPQASLRTVLQTTVNGHGWARALTAAIVAVKVAVGDTV